MSTASLSSLLQELPVVGLAELNDHAQLLTRKDRKYIVTPEQLAGVLASTQAKLAVLEIDGERWFGYESVYFDTQKLDSYRLAATIRPSRFKVRTRTYLQSGQTMVEVKTKDRRGRTVKKRETFEPESGSATVAVREFAGSFDSVSPYASDLRPLLKSTYRRATIVFPELKFRVTVDASFGAVMGDGRAATLSDELIVETKTSGRSSILDRQLWRAGIRPVKVSKYATGLAALRPELSSNRWHRVMKRLCVHQGPVGASDRGSEGLEYLD